MTDWKKETCSEMPAELQEVSPDTYIERKNIRQENSEMNGELVTGWVSDSRFITKDEYNMLKAMSEINSDKAIDDYTLQLIEEGIL